MQDLVPSSGIELCVPCSGSRALTTGNPRVSVFILGLVIVHLYSVSNLRKSNSLYSWNLENSIRLIQEHLRRVLDSEPTIVYLLQAADLCGSQVGVFLPFQKSNASVAPNSCSCCVLGV